MPYGGNDWLALTQEPTLEPEMPICDPHHQFWDFRVERIPYDKCLLHELAADVRRWFLLRSRLAWSIAGLNKWVHPESSFQLARLTTLSQPIDRS